MELNNLMPNGLSTGDRKCGCRCETNTGFDFTDDRVDSLNRNSAAVLDEEQKASSILVQRRSLWTTWKSRLLILRGDYLLICKTEKGSKDEYVKRLRIDDTVKIFLEESESKLKGKLFHVRLVKKQKTFNLCTSSREERNSWVTAFLEVIAKNFIEKRTASTVRPNRTTEVLKLGENSLSLLKTKLSWPRLRRQFSVENLFSSLCCLDENENRNVDMYKSTSLCDLLGDSNKRHGRVLVI